MAAPKEDFRFTVDSALLGELGEKLVSTVHVALAELVKNSYDADATEVTVKITESPDGNSPTVVVEDNGLGMTLDQVRKFWMKIGTSNKSKAPVSERFGRLYTGSKGVGRFACRRLGSQLHLHTVAETKAKSSGKARYQATDIQFDWNEFIPGIDVDEVACSGTTETISNSETGTRLEISGSKTDEWQLRGYNYLARQLALLAANRGAARPGFKKDPGFNVRLSLPGETEQPSDLRETIIKASWGTLVGEVDNKGHARLKLTAKGLRGTKSITSNLTYPLIAGANLEIGILPADKDEVRNPQLLVNYVLRQIIDDWGGIHLHYNGFRVFPYGSPGDDWLEIDKDRGRRLGRPGGELFDFAKRFEHVDPMRALLNMLGMRNYVGNIEVTSEISGLAVRLDRQGFVENKSFQQLIQFGRFAVHWASIHREQYIRNRELGSAQRAREYMRPILKDPDLSTEQLVPKATAHLRHEITRLVDNLPSAEDRQEGFVFDETLAV